MKQAILKHDDVQRAAERLVAKLYLHFDPRHKGIIKLYGIPRGGVSALYVILASDHQGRMVACLDPATADVLVDDVIESGATKNKYFAMNGEALFAVLFAKRGPETGLMTGIEADRDAWLVFPWEAGAESSAHDIVTRMLEYIGEKPEREGLKETPARVAKAWSEWFDGYGVEPGPVIKSFEDGASGYDQMVVQKNIPVYSHCEHHLAPFFGVAHVAYLPGKRIAGLSKFSRVVDIFAHRLQVQERLTTQIADAMNEHLEPRGVGVILECRHLCMESRGVQRIGTMTATSAVRGIIKDSPAVRAEFHQILRGFSHG